MRSSSISHTGLGSRNWRSGSEDGGDASFSFPLPFAPRLRGGAGDAWLPSEKAALVDWLRNGFSNASFILLTLTWPNPGKVSNLSEGALLISAKLYSWNVRR
jgi:hypothetical protein